MKIVEEILWTWPNIDDKYNEIEKEYIESKVRAEELEEARAATDEWDEKLDAIKSFMEFIEVPLEYLPFSEEEVDTEIWRAISEYDNALDKQSLLLSKKQSYKYYIDRINRLRRKDDYGLANRGVENHIVSDAEFYMDMYVFQKIARETKENNGDAYYKAPVSTAYEEIVKQFNVDGMKAVGHPKEDIEENRERAEWICAICRVSWEWEYIERWADEMEKLVNAQKERTGEEKKQARRLFAQQQKQGRKDTVLAKWLQDTQLVETGKNIDPELYCIYRNVFEEKEEELIKRFIKAL